MTDLIPNRCHEPVPDLAPPATVLRNPADAGVTITVARRPARAHFTGIATSGNTAGTQPKLALGRLQNRVADLARAQLAVMELLAQSDVNRIEGAEARVAQCVERLVATALALDRVLTERGDDEGRRRLVEGAMRLQRLRAA